MSSALRIKQRYDIPTGTKGKQATTKLIRSYVDGGNELIDALTRLSEYMHSQSRPEQDTLEIAKTALEEARSHLGDIFRAADDAIEAASNAQDALAELKAQRGHLGPVLHDIYTWLGKALGQMDAPLRLTRGDRERIFLPPPDDRE